jgi:hypothetical protein
MSKENVEIIKQMYEDAGVGKMEQALSALAENIVVYE